MSLTTYAKLSGALQAIVEMQIEAHRDYVKAVNAKDEWNMQWALSQMASLESRYKKIKTEYGV